jgi:hypothetical protein
VAGEAIFVPSGWAHQVHNLLPTISINHNWFNAVNIHSVWKYLKGQCLAVRLSILDCRAEALPPPGRGSLSSFIREETMEEKLIKLTCRTWDEDWEKQCQMLLKINCGINWSDFGDLLMTQSKKMAHLLDKTSQAQDPNSIYTAVVNSGETYLSFSVRQLMSVLKDFSEDMFVQKWLVDGGFFCIIDAFQSTPAPQAHSRAT